MPRGSLVDIKRKQKTSHLRWLVKLAVLGGRKPGNETLASCQMPGLWDQKLSDV
jgi:hypothetical protein